MLFCKCNWKTSFESISVPNHSQEIAFGAIVEGNYFRKAHAVLETSEIDKKFTKIVKTVPIQTFTESKMWGDGPHLTLMCLRIVSQVYLGVERVQ